MIRTKHPFLRFAAVCCFLSVITTLGIHLYFPDPPGDFEQRAVLHKNALYLLNRWWVPVHCLLVVISMWGFALVMWKRAPGTTGLGFLFFAVFAIAEMVRQLFILFYMNELREQYAAATDPALTANLRNLLTYAGLLTAPLFGLFIFSFAVGNLCYGLSLWGEGGLSKWLGVLLLFWAAGTFAAFGNSFWESEPVGEIIDVYSYTFQPLVRLLLGIWLWKKTNEPLAPSQSFGVEKAINKLQPV